MIYLQKASTDRTIETQILTLLFPGEIFAVLVKIVANGISKTHL